MLFLTLCDALILSCVMLFLLGCVTLWCVTSSYVMLSLKLCDALMCDVELCYCQLLNGVSCDTVFDYKLEYRQICLLISMLDGLTKCTAEPIFLKKVCRPYCHLSHPDRPFSFASSVFVTFPPTFSLPSLFSKCCCRLCHFFVQSFSATGVVSRTPHFKVETNSTMGNGFGQ